MRRSVREMISTVLKTAFGTDQHCRMDGHSLDTHHTTEVLAEHTEKKIDRMNAATERLARLDPARNLTEAMRQITGD